MTELTQEKTITQTSTLNPTVVTTEKVEVKSSRTAEYLVYFIFIVLEVLLLSRFIFKLAGANYGSPFIGFIYGVTGIFVFPFEGIFRRGIASGIETASVFEPSTLIAIAVYGFLAWGIVKLMEILVKDL